MNMVVCDFVNECKIVSKTRFEHYPSAQTSPHHMEIVQCTSTCICIYYLAYRLPDMLVSHYKCLRKLSNTRLWPWLR